MREAQPITPKLQLRREALRELAADDLRRVAAASEGNCAGCR
jgi:hypothetical protein